MNATSGSTRAAPDHLPDARRLVALARIRAACADMDAIAQTTDEPDPRDVVAADFLDAAAGLLARNTA